MYEESREEGRYRLLETVREYARDRLIQAGETSLQGERHRDWYLSLVERTEAAWAHNGEGGAIDRLEREHDNLRAALEWSLECREAEAGLRMAGALHEFWF